MQNEPAPIPFVRSRSLRPREPLFVVKVSKIALAFLFFIQVSQRDVQPDALLSVPHRIKSARGNLEAWVEFYRPLDDVTSARRLLLCHCPLRSIQDPTLVRIPRLLLRPGLALQQTSFPNS